MPSIKKKGKTKEPKVFNTEVEGWETPPLDNFHGFSLFPVAMDNDVVHYLYFKKHEGSAKSDDNKTPQDRTLFLINLPVDTTEQHLRQLFRSYCSARVSNVIFQHQTEEEGEEDLNNSTESTMTKKQRKALAAQEAQVKAIDLSLSIRKLQRPGSWAHVVFLEKAELDRVLTTGKKKVVWGEGLVAEAQKRIPPLGLARYLSHYTLTYPPPQDLQKMVDHAMLKFTNAEYEKERRLAEQHNKMDEDGFIMVTRKARRNTNTDGTVTVTAARTLDVQNLKPKKKELVNFYRFQMREQKRNKLVELRQKFEEDKAKIASLKASRRFKPY